MKKLTRIAAIVFSLLMLLSAAFPARLLADTKTERVIIQFAPGEKASVMQTLAADKAQVHYEFDEINAVVATLPASSVERMEGKPGIVAIEPDHLRFAADQTVPYGVDSVEARDVWDANHDGQIDPGAPTGAGRTVCIIDSGVNTSHEDFQGVNFLGGYPSNWNTDTCGHGTHVAGTVAAANNDTGVVGVTPGEVSLYIVKVYGDNCAWTYTSSLLDAAYRCRNAGANIINMSLGGEYYSAAENLVFQQMYDQNNILLVASAGNTGGTAYQFPASYASVISVGAVDQNNVVASFSQKNDRLELVAPGVWVLSTWIDGGYAYMGGTSMAAPHVSAAAAVVWSADLSQSNSDVRSLLQETALDLGVSGRDTSYGYGLVQSLAAVLDLYTPTAVELARFEAGLDGGAVRLEWETTTELDNLGFNLYRSESMEGERAKINGSLIPSQVPPGSLTGATYEYTDETTSTGKAYYYWLEDVDIYGKATLHGPVSIATLTLHRRIGGPISLEGK